MAHNVNLSWTASTDAVDGYNVYRGAAAGAETTTPLNAALITGTTYDDTTAVAGKSYYTVKSSLGGVLSVVSNEIAVSLPPAAPTNLILVSDN